MKARISIHASLTLRICDYGSFNGCYYSFKVLFPLQLYERTKKEYIFVKYIFVYLDFFLFALTHSMQLQCDKSGRR